MKVVVKKVSTKNNKREYDFATFERADTPPYSKQIQSALSSLASNFLIGLYDKLPTDEWVKKSGTSKDSSRPFEVLWSRLDKQTFILEFKTLTTDEDPQPVQYETLD
jgi:hypothetical protein